MRALFIGNSLTARHDVPAQVAALARAVGVELETRLVQAGGASLRRHWNAGAARLIARGAFDVVVLQEQSTLALRGPERMRASVRDFHRAIADAGARAVLVATWARADTPRDQGTIDAVCAGLARELGLGVAPVGAAWARLLRRARPPALHDGDGRHASPLGARLAARVIAGTILGARAARAGLDDLAGDDRALRALAAQGTGRPRAAS